MNLTLTPKKAYQGPTQNVKSDPNVKVRIQEKLKNKCSSTSTTWIYPKTVFLILPWLKEYTIRASKSKKTTPQLREGFKSKISGISRGGEVGVGSDDFPLIKANNQNTGNCIKCIVRQTFFCSICWWWGGGSGPPQAFKFSCMAIWQLFADRYHTESVSWHVQYEKPKEANLDDLSCGYNISLKLKSPHGEFYSFVVNSPTFSFFELEFLLGNWKNCGWR